MTLKERVKALLLIQRRKPFKIFATIAIALIAVAFFATWLVVINAPDATQSSQSIQQQDQPSPTSTGEPTEVEGVESADIQITTASDIRRIIGSRDATLTVALATLSLGALAIIVTWLGLALTYLALLLASSVVVAPLLLYEPTHSLGVLSMGVVVLCSSFFASLEGLRLLLSPTHPLSAVARNVLNEAVRMKIGLIFIVMLIALLASMPLFLDETSPLRYRVQTFLKYASIATFWTLALLTLFFSCATVAFEQRDRTIWTTVCKPISSLQYILGKWLGIMIVNVALISVAAAGIFFFTEHLRRQPAIGELSPFVNASGSSMPTEDRLILESQVLIAREHRMPTTPSPDVNLLRQAVDIQIQQALDRDPGANVEQLRAEFQKEALDAYIMSTRNVEAADESGFRQRNFLFENLHEARRKGRPITLRYKIHAGFNNPTELYRLVFLVNEIPIVEEVPLDTSMSITLRPDVIDDNGRLEIGVINGDPFTGQLNPFSFRFPPDELKILYTAGGYELNFIRIFSAMLIKLGFLAAVGVFGAASLSFPVACFLTALILFAAETSGFLNEGIGIYLSMAEKNDQFVIVRQTIAAIARPVAWMFTAYDAIRPGQNLVEGRLLSWGSLAQGFLIISAWATAALFAAWQIFKRRELAIYSGH
ncbi:MAG: ABC transporter permease [Phycisphaerales bacterium JB043]